MIKKIEAWLRRIIAEVLREVLAERDKEERTQAVDAFKDEPSTWQAEPEEVKAHHELRHPKPTRR